MALLGPAKEFHRQDNSHPILFLTEQSIRVAQNPRAPKQRQMVCASFSFENLVVCTT